MNRLVFLVVFLAGLGAGIPLQLQVSRGMPDGNTVVPLALNGPGLPIVGPADRQADHATVAINEDLDVAIAYHANRTDIGGLGNMKQVEVAYFEYLPGSDSWEHVDTLVVGSIDHHPIQGLNQLIVKCERPDVIAVGNRFFVTWTRRYHEGVSGQENAPAVLEGAWIERGSGTTFEVTGDPMGRKGLGFILDAHVPGGSLNDLFEIKECTGVADAVVLKDASLPAGHAKVAVVYPHQTTFSDDQVIPPTFDRAFTMRVVTCTLDPTGPTNVITSTPHDDIQESIAFNGPTSPGGGASAGLILPDCAPASEDNAFWLIAETQIVTSMAGSPPTGIIKLGYWELVGNAFALQAGFSFKSNLSDPNDPPMIRRRPMISSYPSSNPLLRQKATIAFSLRDPSAIPADPSANVFCVEMQYLNGSIIAPFPFESDWPNESQFNDGKPAPLHGTDSPTKIRQCLADRVEFGSSVPNSLISWDVVAEIKTVLATLIPPGVPAIPGGLGRPAASFQYNTNTIGDPSYVAVVYEQEVIAPSYDPLRIWFGVQ